MVDTAWKLENKLYTWTIPPSLLMPSAHYSSAVSYQAAGSPGDVANYV